MGVENSVCASRRRARFGGVCPGRVLLALTRGGADVDALREQALIEEARRRARQRRLRGRVLYVAGAVVLALAVTGGAVGAGSGLDRSFDGDGVATTDFGGNDLGYTVAVQGDGKVVVAGETDSDFAVARLLVTGALDPGFGSGGKVRFAPLPAIGGISALAVQPDGKIVVAGVGGAGPGRGLDMVVARLTAAGAVDSSFGDGGKTAIDFSGQRDFVLALALQPDGKIVVAGSVFDNARQDEDFALARLDADGKLDAGFGTDGRVRTDFPGGSAEAEAVVIQPDGKIVVAGHAGHAYNSQCSPSCVVALARYGATGALDPTFDGDGLATVGESGQSVARGVALQPDGKIVVAAGLHILRVTATGALDPTFGGGGSLATPAGINAGVVLVDRAGRIVVGGTDFSAGTARVVRLTPAGGVDSRFGAPEAAGAAGVMDGALAPDGKIVLTGLAGGQTPPWDFFTARFTPPRCVAPNVVGKTLAAATRALTAAACTRGRVTRVQSKTVKVGKVMAQTPRAGAVAPEGAAVALRVSRGRR